jgi:hypothetical protein
MHAGVQRWSGDEYRGAVHLSYGSRVRACGDSVRRVLFVDNAASIARWRACALEVAIGLLVLEDAASASAAADRTPGA